MTIHVRVDLIRRESSRDGDQFLFRMDVAAAPMPGELLNINGEPYRVAERSWAFGTDDPRTFCFLRVTRASP